tara:strand:- start:1038 stop:1223 length:186 start_codon:yes stop_codon:yes gene_type:complete
MDCFKQSWEDESLMVWKIILYKERNKDGKQKFYTTSEDFDHSVIAESFDVDDLKEINEKDI